MLFYFYFVILKCPNYSESATCVHLSNNWLVYIIFHFALYLSLKFHELSLYDSSDITEDFKRFSIRKAKTVNWTIKLKQQKNEGLQIPQTSPSPEKIESAFFGSNVRIIISFKWLSTVSWTSLMSTPAWIIHSASKLTVCATPV